VRLTPEAHDLLASAEWPGNVRELDNVVSRAVLRAAFGRSPDETIMVGVEHLDLPIAPPQSTALPSSQASGKPMPLRQQVEEFQRRVIRESLSRHDGKWAAVARELGLHRSNLHTLAKRLGLNT
jgi:anaerobic nitric oxide reductase transcription regulator